MSTCRSRWTAILAVVVLLSLPVFGQTGRDNAVGTVQNLWERNNPTQALPSERIDGGVVSRAQFGFYWETRLMPPTPALDEGFRTKTTNWPGPIHRIMVDRTRRIYFGYDVLIDTLPEANSYRVTFQQLVMTPELAQQLLPDNQLTWVPLPAMVFPGPQTVHGSDVLALTLLTNSTTGQKIVDYLAVQEPAASSFLGFQSLPLREFAFATGSPRDLRTDDVELRLQAPRVSINGKLESSTARYYGDATGVFVWFYLPGRGRYILSLTPHPELGFRKAGEIRGSSLSFAVASETFSVVSGNRIAPGQASFNLYVLHEPGWHPTYQFADLSAFSIDATNHAELLGIK
jgi:hypothetical protein